MADRLTEAAASLMSQIDGGAYGYELPDDEATIVILSECVTRGWVSSESTRIDDFFFLTPAGRRALQSGGDE